MDNNNYIQKFKTKNENFNKFNNCKPSNQFCIGIICKNKISKPRLSTNKICFSIVPYHKIKSSKSSNKLRKSNNYTNKTVFSPTQTIASNNNNYKTNQKILYKEKYSKKKTEYHTTYKNTTGAPNTLINSNISNSSYTNTKIKNNNVKTVEIDLATFDITNELHSKKNTNFNLQSDSNSIIINNIDNNINYDDTSEKIKLKKIILKLQLKINGK